MDLSVIVVNWNTADLTVRCIRAVERQLRSLDGECIVVDNGSEAADVERLASALAGHRIIRNEENRGFAAAVNQGVRASCGRHLLLLNPDAFVGPVLLTHLVAYLDANPQVGAVGPQVLHPDGSVQGSARGFPNAFSAFFGRRALLTRFFPQNRFSRRNVPSLGPAPTEPMEVDWLSGACLAIRRASFEGVGGFDQRFVMYWEDADLCWRIRERGWRVVYDPRVTVVHIVGASSEGAVLRCTAQFHQSAYRFYRKHLTRHAAHPLNVVAAAGLFGRAALLSVARIAARAWARRLSRGVVPETTHLDVTPASGAADETAVSPWARRRCPVTVVIVNWNAGVHLEQCLAALDRQTCRPDQVVVVDNGSDDGSAEGAAGRHRDVRVIRLADNTGFATACNIAAREAGTSAWIATLNPDATPESDWLEKMMDAADRHADCASFASRLVVAGEPELLDGTGDVYHVSGLAWRRHHYGPSSAEALRPGEVFSVCAAAAIYRRDAFLDAGGFDDRFFCYFEDVDLGFRLRLLGYRSWYVPEALVRHAVSASGRRRSPFYVYHGQRNMIWTYAKNMPGPLLWLYAPQHLLANVAGLVWGSLRGASGAALRAKFDGLRGLPHAWRERQAIQRRRNVPIREVRRVMCRGLLTPYVRQGLGR